MGNFHIAGAGAAKQDGTVKIQSEGFLLWQKVDVQRGAEAGNGSIPRAATHPFSGQTRGVWGATIDKLGMCGEPSVLMRRNDGGHCVFCCCGGGYHCHKSQYL